MPIHNPLAFGRMSDMSEGINIIPNYWGVFSHLNVFKHKYGTQKTILVPRKTEQQHILEDRNWNERNPSIAGAQRDFLPLAIPHYPVDDAITPDDVDGNLNLDLLAKGQTVSETVERVRSEKMERIRRAHSLTLEYSRLQVVRDGSVYAPNGTVTTNYYNEFGISREVISVDLNNTVVAPNRVLEDVVGHLQDIQQDGSSYTTDYIALCSPSFFSDLVNNPFVVERYFYVQNSQQSPLLVGRLNPSDGFDARFRSFEYAGITFVEVRGGVNGQNYIGKGDAYIFPRGTDYFETVFAPANRFGENGVNKKALESYYFEYLDEKRSQIEIMTETNFLNILKRPDLVITLRNES